MMLKKVITISSFILIATSYDITSSEPTLKIRYLMNEPMSLFDFGMYKLNEHLKSSSEYILDKREGVVIAVYDPDKNRINILGEAYIDDITQARKVCNDTISSIKSTLGVSYKTGEKISASAPDPIGSYFRYASVVRLK